MRRAAALALVLAAVPLVPHAWAKFGMSKTKVTLKRQRPPDAGLIGDTATVEVTTRSRRVSDRQLDRIRRRVEGAIEGRSIRLVEKGADNLVRVEVDDVEARVNDTVVYEDKYVQTGTKQEWNEKKKKYETKAVYGNRREPVQVKTVNGALGARVQVKTPLGEDSGDASVSYQDEFKGEVRIPAQASTETALEEYLIDSAAERAAGVVAFTADPVEALLAVDGELKDGNRLADAGLWKEALGAWERKTFKGDKEAARLHNTGVAHEALAYALPPESPEHRAALDTAADLYKKALALDPGEKYFSPPIERIQASIGYADSAKGLAADAQKWKDDGARRQAARADRTKRETTVQVPTAVAPPVTAAPKPRRAASAPVTTPVATTPAVPVAAPVKAPAQSGLGSSASVVAPLRNGSFESSLSPWTPSGKAAVIDSPGRGKVLQTTGAAGAAASVTQTVGVDVGSASGASLSLDYKVVGGEGQVRVFVTYDDAQGRARTSTLEVTAGDPPGAWTPWTADVAGLRPRPARVKEVRVAVESGTVLLDNVALTVR